MSGLTSDQAKLALAIKVQAEEALNIHKLFVKNIHEPSFIIGYCAAHDDAAQGRLTIAAPEPDPNAFCACGKIPADALPRTDHFATHHFSRCVILR